MSSVSGHPFLTCIYSNYFNASATSGTTYVPVPYIQWSLRQAISRMHRMSILDNCFTELVFCGLSCFPFRLPHFLTLSTLWKETGIVEKEGGLPGFDIDILNTFSFLLTAEVTDRLPGKIGSHLPTIEGLNISAKLKGIQEHYPRLRTNEGYACHSMLCARQHGIALGHFYVPLPIRK